jgi:hypothetical protein
VIELRFGAEHLVLSSFAELLRRDLGHGCANSSLLLVWQPADESNQSVVRPESRTRSQRAAQGQRSAPAARLTGRDRGGSCEAVNDDELIDHRAVSHRRSVPFARKRVSVDLERFVRSPDPGPAQIAQIVQKLGRSSCPARRSFPRNRRPGLCCSALSPGKLSCPARHAFPRKHRPGLSCPERKPGSGQCRPWCRFLRNHGSSTRWPRLRRRPLWRGTRGTRGTRHRALQRRRSAVRIQSES